MNKDQLVSALQHACTGVGTLAATLGTVKGNAVAQICGGCAILIGLLTQHVSNATPPGGKAGPKTGILTALVVLLGLSAGSARAAIVTNSPLAVSTNAVPTNLTATNIGQLLGIPPSIAGGVQLFVEGLQDASPYLTNDIGDIGVDALYNTSLKKFGAFMSLGIPYSQQAEIMIGGGRINGHFFDANLSLKLGTTTTWPIIGKGYLFAQSGPEYDFRAQSIGAINFAGYEKTWDLGKNWLLTAEAKVGNISTVPGTTLGLGIRVSKTF